jgi:hypothetical protein
VGFYGTRSFFPCSPKFVIKPCSESCQSGPSQVGCIVYAERRLKRRVCRRLTLVGLTAKHQSYICLAFVIVMVLIMEGRRPQARSQSHWFPQFISLWLDPCSSFNDGLRSLSEKNKSNDWVTVNSKWETILKEAFVA